MTLKTRTIEHRVNEHHPRPTDLVRSLQEVDCEVKCFIAAYVNYKLVSITAMSDVKLTTHTITIKQLTLGTYMVCKPQPVPGLMHKYCEQQ